MLALLGVEQEEEMKRICQEELGVWWQRPSVKRAISLQKPLTETRNRIREVLPLEEEYDDGRMTNFRGTVTSTSGA